MFSSPRDRDRHPGIEAAIAAAGGVNALGRACEPPITGEAVSVWKLIPVKHVLTLERKLGIPRHELRPDVYPPPDPPKRNPLTRRKKK